MPLTEPSAFVVFTAPETGPGHDPRKMAYFRVGDLVIDQNVQRDVDPGKIEKMGEFDYYLVETPTVIRRADGVLAVIEGQHRVIKMQTDPDYGDDSYVFGVLFEAGVDEAAIAAAIARSRTRHNPYQLWQLDLAQGKELQVAAQEILGRLGLEFSKPGTTSSGRRITAVASVGQIMRMEKDLEEGADLLDTVLSVLITAFDDQQDMFSGLLLKAVAKIVHNNPGIDIRRLARVLSHQAPGRWIAEKLHRREGQPALECIGSAIVDDYNRMLHAQSKIGW